MYQQDEVAEMYAEVTGRGRPQASEFEKFWQESFETIRKVSDSTPNWSVKNLTCPEVR